MSGWKTSNCIKDDNIFACIEENGYSAQDILVSKEIDKFKPIFKNGKIVELFAAASNQSIKLQKYYLNNNNVMVHVLRAEYGIISNNYATTFGLHLNNSLNYFIIIHDPKIAITTSMTGIIPRFFVVLEKGQGLVYISLKVGLL